MPGSIPSESDWRSEPWGIDTSCAYEHFSGKSSEEAFQLFQHDACCFQEDLMFMPEACLPFYAGAYMKYLMSAHSRGDSDGAGCFFGLAEFRADEIRTTRGLTRSFVRCLEHLAQRQQYYDAEESIYGSFPERAEKALRLLV